jgi:four helix bundle protein
LQDYTKLKVWAKAHELTLGVYAATRVFPADERFGLISQLRRSTASIPSNIAEGAGRGSDLEFKRFLHYAVGSANETNYQLLLSRDLGYLGQEDFRRLDELSVEVKRMLAALIARVRNTGGLLDA